MKITMEQIGRQTTTIETVVDSPGNHLLIAVEALAKTVATFTDLPLRFVEIDQDVFDKLMEAECKFYQCAPFTEFALGEITFLPRKKP